MSAEYEHPFELSEYHHCSETCQPCGHAFDISQKPDFRIFTSLLWIRCGNDCYEKGDSMQDAGSHAIDEERNVPNKGSPNHGLLPLHSDRLTAAAKALGWQDLKMLGKSEPGSVDLSSSISHHLASLPGIHKGQIERRKIKIAISKHGIVEVDSTVMSSFTEDDAPDIVFMPESLDLHKAEKRLCQVFIDMQPTTPSLFTQHKTTYRPHYDAARARSEIQSALPTEKEVLLYNTNGDIMEASLCTVYFRRNGGWVTPAADCGGLRGVTRRLALDKGLCTEGVISKSEARIGEVVWLSNAARGFFLGHICLCYS